MARERLGVMAAGLVILILTFLAGWGMGRSDECEIFRSEVEGYVAALVEQGVPDGQVAPRSSDALRDEQPEGCDVL